MADSFTQCHLVGLDQWCLGKLPLHKTSEHYFMLFYMHGTCLDLYPDLVKLRYQFLDPKFRHILELQCNNFIFLGWRSDEIATKLLEWDTHSRPSTPTCAADMVWGTCSGKLTESLIFTTLWANSAENKLVILFLFFPENRILHYIQIVSVWDNLHDMSNTVFWEK